MGKKCNSHQWWNNVICWCECKNCHICEKDYIWNHTTCSCENGKYLACLMDDSAITRDKIIEEEAKTVTTNFNEKNALCKIKKFYILITFLLITIALLIAVSIYRYLIEYKA